MIMLWANTPPLIGSRSSDQEHCPLWWTPHDDDLNSANSQNYGELAELFQVSDKTVSHLLYSMRKSLKVEKVGSSHIVGSQLATTSDSLFLAFSEQPAHIWLKSGSCVTLPTLQHIVSKHGTLCYKTTSTPPTRSCFVSSGLVVHYKLLSTGQTINAGLYSQ